MPETLYVLTQSAALVDLFEWTSPGDRRIRAVACLAEVGCQVSDVKVVVDPRALESCCMATLRDRSRRGIQFKVRFLDLPVPSRSKHEMRGSVLPCIALKDQRHEVSWTPGQDSNRAAWARRDHLFEHAPGELREAHFLALARRHRHEAYGESAAAADLRLSVRQLTRLAIGWFGYSPRVVSGLFRVESVGRWLRLSTRSLKDIARAHGYGTRQAMNRHFHAFTGFHPAAYRAPQQPREALMADSEMSEYGPSPDDSDRGIYLAEGTLAGLRPIGVGHDRVATAAPIQPARCPSAQPFPDGVPGPFTSD